jgi:predicted O-methyltransferase YrrM
VAYAQNVFEQFGLDQIIVKQGVFNQLLPNVIQSAGKLDMVFLDGDHTYKGTLGYFEQIAAKAHNETVVVLDDIHWSAEMEAAWKHIQQKDEVTVSIDLFRIGIIFFKKELSKQNFMIKY